MPEPQKDRIHEQLERGADAAITGLGKLGRWVKGVAKATGEELTAAGKELRTDIELAGEKFTRDVLPAAEKKLGQVVDKAGAHIGLAGRRVMAEALAAAKDPEKLQREIEQEFSTAKAAVNQQVSLRRAVTSFIKSDYGVLEFFDNSGTLVKGIAVYPKDADLKTLQNEFIPVRLFVGEKGLTARTYTPLNENFGKEGAPRYAFAEERPATAQDLFELRVKATDVTAAIAEAKTSQRFKSYVGSEESKRSAPDSQ